MNTIRKDDRDSLQLRPFKISQGLLNNADGSGFFSSGKHSLVSGIYGPTEVKAKDEALGEAYVEVNYKPPTGIPGPAGKLIELAIRSTFDRIILKALHPRSMIQINLQHEHSDGEPISLAINATMVALIDTGIPVLSILTGAACAITQDGEYLADPTSEEIKNAVSLHSFGFASSPNNSEEGSIAFSESCGIYSMSQYRECYNICLEATSKTAGFLREAISKKLAP